jgi:hypothetical protein
MIGFEIAQSVERRAGRPEFDSRQRQEIILYCTSSRPALGPTQPPTQWTLWALSPGAKRPERKAHQSPTSSADVNNGGAIPPFPTCLDGIVLN